MFCRFCGQKIPEESEFCPFCGKSSVLSDPPETPQTQVAAPKTPEPTENGGQSEPIGALLPEEAHAQEESDAINMPVDPQAAAFFEPMPQMVGTVSESQSQTPVKRQRKKFPKWLWFVIGGTSLLIVIGILIGVFANKPEKNPANAATSSAAAVTQKPSDKADTGDDANALPPVNDPDYRWPTPGEGERLFIGEGHYDEVGRFYAAFILAEDGFTIHDLTLRAEDISLDINSGGQSISVSGTTAMEQHSSEYDISPGFLEMGNSRFEVIQINGDVAYGELDYVYVYRNFGINNGSSAEIPVDLGLTQIEFTCYIDNSGESAAAASKPTPAKTDVPAPTDEPLPDTQMLRVYEKAAKTSALVEYDAEDDAVVIPYTETTADVEETVAAINAALGGAPLRLKLTHKLNYGDSFPSGEYPYEALYALECSELSLIDEYFSSHGGREKGDRLPNLTDLTIAAATSWRDFPELPNVRSLTFLVSGDAHSGQFGRISHLSGLESFTLRIDKGAFIDGASIDGVYALAYMPALRTVNIEGNVDANSRMGAALICEAASMAPAIESICGKTAYFAKEELSEAEMAEFEKLRTQEFCLYFREEVLDDLNEEGRKDPGGKTMVHVAGGGSDFHSSYDAEVAGDYYGIDPEKLTTDPKECTRMIIVYADYEKVGFYTNGVTANKTRTTVAVIDTAERRICSTKVVATTDPPQQIKGFQSGSGEYLPEKAKSYVLKLLK